MKSELKDGLVPKLRFPEFRDADSWRIKQFGELLTESRNPSENSDPKRRITVKLHMQGVEHREYRGTESLNSVNNFIRKAGQFVYGKQNIHKGAFGIIPQHLDGFETSQDLPAFDFAENCSPQWFCSYISSEQVYSSLEEKMSGTGSKRLNEKIFLELPIAAPSENEQQKIADCLFFIDELIALETQKFNTFKSHQKGLMQKLLPAEGETLPKLRLPEFRDAAEWELQRIEDRAKRGSGHTPDKKKPGYYNGGIKWVSLADSNKLDKGYLYSTKIEISKEGLKNSSAVLYPAGTVIVSRDAGVGKSAIIYSDMAVSQHFMAWICDKSKFSNWFLYYSLQKLKPVFERVAVGSTIKTIGLPYFKELCISIPSIVEQQKIADCLFSIDELVTAQAEKIDMLKTQKKGLMQKLFPAIDEVNR